MGTYTTNIDLTNFIYPVQITWLFYTNSNNSINLLVVGQNNINDWASATATAIELNIGGNTSVTYQANTNNVKFIINTDVDSDDLVALQVYDANDFFFQSSWQLSIPTTLCPTCQDLQMPDCEDPSFDLDIDDGTYIVTIKDNTAQTYYTQTVEFADGQAQWSGDNTAGVFTPYNVYTITIQDEDENPVTWLNGYDEYNCLRLTFAPTTDTTPEP